MRKHTVHLTYDIVTEASAVDGEAAYSGFVTKGGGMPRVRSYIPKKPAEFTLRRGLEMLMDGCVVIEADSYPWNKEQPPRWLTSYRDSSEDGESVSVSLHLPRNMSASTRCRIARLVGAYGGRKA